MFEVLKKHAILDKTARACMSLVTYVSPVMASKLYFFKEFRKLPDLKTPKTFTEKLMYLKLKTYNNNHTITMCADKYLVREYVTERGCQDILNTLYGVWNSTEEIIWDDLPQQFVMKCNHGCGYNIICKDKSKYNRDDVFKTLNNWMREEFWVKKAEVNYRKIPHKIICESYIDDGTGELPVDYKIYCFNGVPTAILVICDRSGDKRGAFMSPEWAYFGTPDHYKSVNELPARPNSLDRMVSAASILSEPFPFVRVDFYQGENSAIFGELTFTPGDCLHPAEMTINGTTMGDMIILGGNKHEQD